jgi:hypothetical protein
MMIHPPDCWREAGRSGPLSGLERMLRGVSVATMILTVSSSPSSPPHISVSCVGEAAPMHLQAVPRVDHCREVEGPFPFLLNDPAGTVAA